MKLLREETSKYFLNGTSPIYEDFDIIYFGSSLQYINDYKSCLRNCCKKLNIFSLLNYRFF